MCNQHCTAIQCAISTCALQSKVQSTLYWNQMRNQHCTAIQDAIRLHFFLLRKYNALVLCLPRQRVVSIYMVCYIWYFGSGFDILGLWTLILYLGTYLTYWVCNWRLGWRTHFLIGDKKDIQEIKAFMAPP